MGKPTPRVIFVRHGQTEWSKSGQYTSVTDLSLTAFGVKQMKATGKHLIGNSDFQMIKPQNLTHVFTSPRTRAKQTVDLLIEGIGEETKAKIPINIENDLREWEYGDYEGLLTSQIINLRAERGLDKDLAKGDTWNIWRDGCENGEVNEQVKQRLDGVIDKIKAIHRKALENNQPSDIIVVGHGHILRCFAARWVGKEINVNPQFLLDAGGVGVLSYQHHNIDEPALYLAGAFTVPIEEEGVDQ
ncbi:phosphoglycerate mutase-like protein [Hyphopichia burtonii NRRL Y-1933]|uniref:Phosphoglycerate mutase-like protein n=1 Tax=Hyphopichia burtonii NRRL Y-1933 TaxID=984485 RepID=A0A1E4RI19_9ASCO|nr:phosphoglycerate mutase-like protein [Hyphopichia burtonii NRRL Y-1933]ODV66866.1 phosphoglycerate mutase-like protein [Hyphopichia burtonii NRRL Y-1933]